MERLNKCPAWAAGVFLCLFLSLAFSSASSKTEGKRPRSSPFGLLRSKRQGCVDGTYEHNGVNCCMCGAGQKVEKDCDGKNDVKCTYCDANTYSSHPNSQTVCEPCTSCDQPNANLEVDKPCTPASNTKCRCKKDHYCPHDALDTSGTCRICHPCKECESRIKVACTATNNTVCSEDIGLFIGIGVSLGVLVAIGLLAFYCLRKRKEPANPPEEGLLFRDLQPHLTEIVEIIGWRDMKTIAMASKMRRTSIEFCERDNPGDAQQQTLQLLEAWIESEGRNASITLVKMLRRIHKNNKAEQVKGVLSQGSAA